MKIYAIPRWLDALYPKRVWRLKTPGKVCLTFDDGPFPSTTPWLLEFLAKENIKAVFFLLGQQMDKHPELLQQITKAGHQIGNHGWSHNKSLTENVVEMVNEINRTDVLYPSLHFRPPYGKLKSRVAKSIRKTHSIVMWSWMSYDYDKTVRLGEIYKSAERDVKDGSILVWHENEKSTERLKIILPKVVRMLRSKGYDFTLISP